MKLVLPACFVFPCHLHLPCASLSVWIHPAGQGVKLVLPALLKGVEDKAWRTKQGSIQVIMQPTHKI